MFILLRKTDAGFKMHLNTDEVECDSLVIATGGLFNAKTGRDPFGYKVAEQFGLSVVPTTAGLVPFTPHKEDKEAFAELSGIAIPAEITAQDGTLFKEALTVYSPRPIWSFGTANLFILEKQVSLFRLI